MKTRIMWAAVTLLWTFAARADIFQWEWADPANPNLGKRQSTELCPHGAGVSAVPAEILDGRDLTKAYLISADLSRASAVGTVLTTADLSKANLADADLTRAILTGAQFFETNLSNANFTDAEIRGADFSCFAPALGLTAAQLYSTASYKSRNLTGIVFAYNNDLSGWDFAAQNLSNASFSGATLSNAIFTDADVRGVDFWKVTQIGFTAGQLHSTASYKAKNLAGIKLWGNDVSGWDFAGQNLTGASFEQAWLNNANFTDAEIRGANFGATSYGFTAGQLYSTASYKAKNLSGIVLWHNDISGWNFAGQNLSNARFDAANLRNANFAQANLAGAYLGDHYDMRVTLDGANFRQANLTNATLGGWNELFNVDLLGADARGALAPIPIRPGTMILPNGFIPGLDLSSGSAIRSLTVRNYGGDPDRGLEPIPIIVQERMRMGTDGTLRVEFDVEPWHSTISFDGIPVSLGGTLNLDFAEGVDVASQIGRTFDVFDWTGATRTGTFAVSSPYSWDLTQLYTSGDVTLAAVPEPSGIALLPVGAFGLLAYAFGRGSGMKRKSARSDSRLSDT